MLNNKYMISAGKIENNKSLFNEYENVKDPRTFASWKEFLPKERWEKTVRPLKEEDKKNGACCMVFYYIRH